MSLFQYNGITLPDVFHTSFRQEVVYDDQGHTDWFCTKFDIEVQAVINANYANLLFPGFEGRTDNAAVFMKVVRAALLRPRRRLRVQFNGVDLIPNVTAAGGGTVDAQNGPKPQHCTITQLTNVTFLITYRIIAHYWENNSSNANAPDPNKVLNSAGNPVLSNRWTESVELNNLGYSTRIREGKYVIRSDNNAGAIVDRFRSQMAVLGVLKGFLRESASYTVAPDGLGLMYKLVDREVFKNPPNPSFSATGTYTESTPYSAPLRYMEVNLRLEGPKSVPQDQLISLAIAIAMSKIGRQVEILNPVSPGQAIPTFAAVRVGMYENWVETILRAQTPVTQDRTTGLDANFSRLTYTPGSDAVVAGGPTAPTPAYQLYGTAGVVPQAAAYYDPSILATVVDPDTGQFDPPGREVGQAGNLPEA